MYSKKDYVETLSREQLLELFILCIRYDSFKIALQLYMNHISANDINSKLMEYLILSMRDSVRLFEIKLYFILTNFDLMTIEQMNTLVDILVMVFNKHEYKMNPMLSQLNTIKVSLLVYRISWKIEQKKIYSLITKCEMVNKNIFKCLNKFLSNSTNIAQIYKFMLEPVLSTMKD